MANAGSVAPPGVGTHEDVHVTGRRVLAIIVDGLLIGIPASLVSQLLLGTNYSVYSGSVNSSLVIVVASFSVVLTLLYYTLLEGSLGQTVGKMLLGIKVVREDTGGVPGIGAAAIRNVLRVVDGLFGYLVGFIVVLASSKRQRLGDMAAHTLVVRK
jgi:uncharacterized RDD family membrane protein YckC